MERNILNVLSSVAHLSVSFTVMISTLAAVSGSQVVINTVVTYIALGRGPPLITSSSSMAQVSLVMRWCFVVSEAEV
jgi:hypothetical protein